MSNHSYNAGYHRGLNTEYHDVPINILFTKWIADVRRPASGEAFDIVAFEKGITTAKTTIYAAATRQKELKNR